MTVIVDSTQNIISFCTGYGGIELGLRRVSDCFRTVAYVEIEAFAIANLVAKIEQGKLDAAPIWSDIKTFDGEPFRGTVHGLIGGYPCQGESLAGGRKGQNDDRWLWEYIRDAISVIRPQWCFFENVEGHASSGLRKVLCDLEKLGYRVESPSGKPTWGMFTAAERGANHIRRRIFILAYDYSQGKPQLQGMFKEFGGRLSDGIKEGIHTDPMHVGYEGVQRLPSDNKQARSWRERATRAISESFKDSFEWRSWKIKPFIRGKDDGIRNRSHRIRLLGNGVNPESAELAFRTLWEIHAR